MKTFQETLSIAPMMDCTCRHYRYFMRLISKKTTLYTEMVHTNQILFADSTKFLSYDNFEHPLVLQLGGSSPKSLAKCCEIAQKKRFNAINLNLGCPSERVQKGQFGACLMKEADLVKTCLNAMKSATDLPITVKTRLGVDDFDSERFFFQFVESLAQTGVRNFIIHARKAWLKGLNPKQNRNIPPLNYDRVYVLKQTFPELYIGINGGINSLEAAKQHLQNVDAVMIGREAFSNPYMLAEADSQIFNLNPSPPTRLAVFKAYWEYAQIQYNQGVKLNQLIRPILGLFHGRPGGRQWRGYLTTQSYKAQNNLNLFEESLQLFEN